jgi:ribonuclease G
MPGLNLCHVDKELIINAAENGVELALMEAGKLAELHHQETNNNFAVGDIFIGKIRKLMPGLNAGFCGYRPQKGRFFALYRPRDQTQVAQSSGQMA